MVRVSTTRAARLEALKAARLAKRDREITVLVGGLGVSYAAAGRRLGIEAESVRAHARDLKQRLGSDRRLRETLSRLFIARLEELGPLVETLDEELEIKS